MQTKLPGIMGGMGPEATVDFMYKVLQSTKAEKDQDHIRMLIDHDPKVPNRHAAIKGQGREELGLHLAHMAKGLENSGADFVVMVCNTAHAFENDIKKAINIPFVSIIDVTVNAIKTNYPEISKIGVMAAEGALDAELYQHALTRSGYDVILWSPEELNVFMALVYQVKSGNTGPEIRTKMQTLAASLTQQGAELLIAGCTEIPLILSADEITPPLLESTSELVSEVIRLSTTDT